MWVLWEEQVQIWMTRSLECCCYCCCCFAFPPILVLIAVCLEFHLWRAQDLGIGHTVCLHILAKQSTVGGLHWGCGVFWVLECVHTSLGLSVCLLMPGLSVDSADMIAAQVFQGRSTSKSAWLLWWYDYCLAPLGVSKCWCVSSKSKHWASGVRAEPLWRSSVKVEWEQRWGWHSTRSTGKRLFAGITFFQLRTGLRCPDRTLLLGLTVHPLRGLLTQPH